MRWQRQTQHGATNQTGLIQQLQQPRWPSVTNYNHVIHKPCDYTLSVCLQQQFHTHSHWRKRETRNTEPGLSVHTSYIQVLHLKVTLSSFLLGVLIILMCFYLCWSILHGTFTKVNDLRASLVHVQCRSCRRHPLYHLTCSLEVWKPMIETLIWHWLWTWSETESAGYCSNQMWADFADKYLLNQWNHSVSFFGSLNCFTPYHSVHGLPMEDLCQRSQALMPTEMAASNLTEPAAFLA